MDVLQEAQRAVEGARHKAYGTPAENHPCTAEMFRVWRERRGADRPFDAVDVCAFNIIQKLSRLANAPDHRDSLVDIAGYAKNWALVLGIDELPSP